MFTSFWYNLYTKKEKKKPYYNVIIADLTELPIYSGIFRPKLN